MSLVFFKNITKILRNKKYVPNCYNASNSNLVHKLNEEITVRSPKPEVDLADLSPRVEPKSRFPISTDVWSGYIFLINAALFHKNRITQKERKHFEILAFINNQKRLF